MGRVQLTDANMGGDGSITADPGAAYSAGDTVPVSNTGGGWNFNQYNPYVYGNVQSNPGGYAPPAPSYNPPPASPSFGVGTSAPGAYGGGNTPAPQAAPVQTPDQWLAGDSTFQGQENDYNSQLKAFLDRLNQQKSDYNTDFQTAQNAFNKNMNQNMLALGEDWTSRGMANSGLFNQARDLATSNYADQQNGMNTANKRALANFDQQGNDRQSEINQAIENARQQSLARMAANQSF